MRARGRRIESSAAAKKDRTRYLGIAQYVAITETILMEVLAGATAGEALARIRAELIARPILRLEGLADFEEAAQIYRTCRSAGHTLRSQLDCLIAVPVIRHGASLLHNDRDFETIARYSTLKLDRVQCLTAGACPAARGTP